MTGVDQVSLMLGTLNGKMDALVSQSAKNADTLNAILEWGCAHGRSNTHRIASLEQSPKRHAMFTMRW